MQRMKRFREDRGAVAVWVAVMMVPLLGVAALAIDVGALHADRQRLQHGADAAALAIAQQCAQGACGATTATAQELAEANAPQGGPVTAVVDLQEGAGWVEVETSSARDLWFGPVLGQGDKSLTARGAASWGQYPTGGSHLPLAISWCEIAHWAGLGAEDVIVEDGEIVGLDIPEQTADVVLFSKGKSTDFNACPEGAGPTGPNGYEPPGGFGWLPADSECSAATAVDGWVASSTGRPSTCSTLDSMIGQTVLVPIFDETQDQGSGAEYHIFGYVGFTLEGYRNNLGSAGTVPSECTANADCIFGTIERFVDLGSGFSSSASGPQLGSSVVELRMPAEG